MNGQWDFTIGLRETRDLYLLLMREKWRGGILGFGAAGALTAVLYTGELAENSGTCVPVAWWDISWV